MTNEAAFERGTKLIVGNMLRSFYKRLEISMLYGQKEIGKVNANTVAVATLVVADADWAPGIWNGSEGAKIDIFNAALTIKRNATEISVVSVDMTTKTVTVSAAQTLTAGDRIMFKGAYDLAGSAWKECLGLQGVMQAFDDGVTSLFGVNPQTYNVWRSTSYAVGGLLTFAKVQDAVGRACARGLDEDAILLVSNATWAKLLTEQAALRMYDSSFRKEVAENGSEKLLFNSQNGMIEIRASNFIKEGLAMCFPARTLQRIGSTDVTFKLPMSEGEDRFFRLLVDSNGFEIRAYSDQALFCSEPNKLLILTGITN
jgi:hypothetical protein